MPSNRHERIMMGVELECYNIVTPDYRITRELAFPRPGVSERGERFGRDWSIGTEYNSRPFKTIREGLFLLKAGLRKYRRHLYRSKSRSRKGNQILLVGGWRDRFAGAHIHLSVVGEKLTKEDARHLTWHLHDHIPLLVAMGANSPVWADELTHVASNRIARASSIYFKPIPRNRITSRSTDELLYSRGRKTKPPTIELRVMDSNVPEFVMAAACVIKAVALAWLAGKGAANRIPQSVYLKTRAEAAHRGMLAMLSWNGERMRASRYLDRIVWNFRDEFADMDIPQDLWTAMKLLKKGYNGSRILLEAARLAHKEHPQTWQRRFAKRYVGAIDHLLSGHSILDFAERLHVEVPDISDTWLGRRRLRL